MPQVKVYNVCTHSIMNTNRTSYAVISCHPKNPLRFITGGGDKNVTMWQFSSEYRSGLETICQLTLHSKSVSVLDWNIDGTYFASGCEDGIVAVWKEEPLKNNKNNNNNYDCKEYSPIFGQTNEFKPKENWKLHSKIRCNADQLVDLTYVKKAEYNNILIVSSLRGDIFIIDSNKGNIINNVKTQIKTFVQGVCIDPYCEYIGIQSSNPSLKLYKRNKKRKTITFNKCDKNLTYFPIVKHNKINNILNDITNTNDKNNNKMDIDDNNTSVISNNNNSINNNNNIKQDKMEIDENDTSNNNNKTNKTNHIKKKLLFGKISGGRPCWSPDGLFLCAAVGVSNVEAYINNENNKINNNNIKSESCIHFFHRSDLYNKVSDYIFKNINNTRVHPSCIRFCPIKYCINNLDSIDKLSLCYKYKLKYKMIFSVISKRSIYVFDTSKCNPIFYWEDSDIEQFKDMSWTCDGKSLIVTDVESFLTQIQFTQF